MRNTRQTTSDTVIPLSAHRTERPPNPLRRLEDYWSSLRTHGQVPKRSQIDPRALSSVLDHVFLLEQTAPGDARIRVAGSRLTQLAGLELRGLSVLSMFHTRAQPALSAALQVCLDRPAIIDSKVTARSLQHAPDAQGDFILLPLRCDTGSTSRIIGALSMKKPLLSDAYRLVLHGTRVSRLHGSADRDAPAKSSTQKPRPHRLELVHSSDWVN